MNGSDLVGSGKNNLPLVTYLLQQHSGPTIDRGITYPVASYGMSVTLENTQTLVLNPRSRPEFVPQHLHRITSQPFHRNYGIAGHTNMIDTSKTRISATLALLRKRLSNSKALGCNIDNLINEPSCFAHCLLVVSSRSPHVSPFPWMSARLKWHSTVKPCPILSNCLFGTPSKV